MVNAFSDSLLSTGYDFEADFFQSSWRVSSCFIQSQSWIADYLKTKQVTDKAPLISLKERKVKTHAEYNGLQLAFAKDLITVSLLICLGLKTSLLFAYEYPTEFFQ